MTVLKFIGVDSDSDINVKEETLNKKPIQIYSSPLDHALHIDPAIHDAFRVYGKLQLDDKVLYEKTIECKADSVQVVDTMAFFVIEDDLGFSSAVAVAFGKKK